jgi:hypothetical protein
MMVDGFSSCVMASGDFSVKATGGEKYATWPTKMLVDVHVDFVLVRW